VSFLVGYARSIVIGARPNAQCSLIAYASSRASLIGCIVDLCCFVLSWCVRAILTCRQRLRARAVQQWMLIEQRFESIE
jgi:hypothetical protein